MVLTEPLYALAEAQLGLVSRAQLITEVGLPRARAAMESPGLQRVTRGVYRLRGTPVHRHTSALARGLRWGDRSVVTGAAALELGGPAGVHLGSRAPALVGLAPGLRIRSPGVATIVDHPPGRRATRLGAIRVALPVDALVDLLTLPGPASSRELRLAFDQLRWAGMLRPGELRRRSTELGVADAIDGHELLDHDGGASTGWGERRLEGLARRFDPEPHAQYWVTPTRRADLYFPGVRLAVEYQGSVDHEHAAGRARDRVRDAELAAAGIRVLYLSRLDLRDEVATMATIAAALTTRAHQLGTTAPHLTSR